jgi:hypothetical protein
MLKRRGLEFELVRRTEKQAARLTSTQGPALASAEEELRRSRTRLGSSCGKISDYSGRHVRRWRCRLLRAPPPCSKREKWGVPQPNTRQKFQKKKVRQMIDVTKTECKSDITKKFALTELGLALRHRTVLPAIDSDNRALPLK